ncbi:MAG: hypothetical protein V9G19_16755 [Tetrasphaera sp.]
MQTPSRFSPSGALVVPGNASMTSGATDLVLTPGDPDVIREVSDVHFLAGWLDDERILYVDANVGTACGNYPKAGRACLPQVALVTVDLAKQRRSTATITLPPLEPIASMTVAVPGGINRWTPRLSADRRTLWLHLWDDENRLALAVDISDPSRPVISAPDPDRPYQFLGDGDGVSEGGVIPVGDRPGALTRHGLVIKQPLPPPAGGGARYTEQTVTLLAPRWRATLVLVAGDAYAGKATGRATADTVLGWWWQHLVAGAPWPRS